MKNLISFCCYLTFITATIILCVEFKIDWYKVAVSVGWFAHMIYCFVLNNLKKDKK